MWHHNYLLVFTGIAPYAIPVALSRFYKSSFKQMQGFFLHTTQSDVVSFSLTSIAIAISILSKFIAVN
jgi:hypothetical protein